MFNKRIWLLGLLIILCSLSSCTIKDAAEGLLDACGDENMADLMVQDDISQECRDYIQDLLAPSHDNLSDNIIAAGQGEYDGDKVLLLMGADADGNAIDLDQAEELSVMVDGKEIPKDAYIVNRADQLEGLIVSTSGALDYSGSMFDSHIDDAINIYSMLFKTPLGMESEFSIFSNTILQKTGFTVDNEKLSVAIARDNDYDRKSTALFDAMGQSIDSLSGRDSMVKLLVVATDGGENSSTTFSNKDDLLQKAIDNKVIIIVIGSLLADTDFMKEAAQKTGGFYFYIKDGFKIDYVKGLFDVLENMSGIQITDDKYKDGEKYEVIVDGHNLEF